MHRILWVVIAAVACFAWCSALSFVPVPWPDDSAFFLPAVDFVHWPPVFRQHSQAPFVPSYDIANFNTMPGMPTMLGLGRLIGIDGSHGIRLWGMAAFAAYAILLALWMRKRNAHGSWTWLIALGAILSPSIRWGAMVVRTEIWQGLLWLLMLMELDGAFERKSEWRLPALLALAAYFHFEGIIWVTPLVCAILVDSATSWRERLLRLLGIGVRTAILLAPWLAYVGFHWTTFWQQMSVQFGRVDADLPTVRSWYGLFHSLFQVLGNPATYPKFFNLGKALTWLAFALAVVLNLGTGITKSVQRPVKLAAVGALAITMYLWLTKPETWFTTMVHLALWPALVLLVPTAVSRSRVPARAAFALLSLLVVLEAGTAFDQWRKLREDYTWDRYHQWVHCIDSAIGPRTKIWQPHWPDVLVELSSRKPDRDYTRAVDFRGTEPLLRRHAARSEVIIHSLYLENPDHRRLSYSGPARDLDRYYLRDYPWLPLQAFSALSPTAPFERPAELIVCQKGPFWAAVTLR